MKIINIIILLILTSFVVSSAQQTIISSSNDFRFDLLRYNPSPLEPGKSSNIYIQVTNIKSKPILESEIILATDFPLTVINRNQKLPILNPGQSHIIIFQVNAHKDAKEGIYSGGLEFTSSSGSLNTEKLKIEVKRLKKSITTTGIFFTPEKLTPGKEGSVKIIIKNTGRSTIKDVKIKIDTSNSSTPFITIGSTSERKIQNINADEEAEATFSIIALPSSVPGIYKVPLIISYIDEFGSENSNTEILGVIISAPIQYELIISDRTVFVKNDNGVITVSISNNGPSPIKYMTISLLPSDNYDILSKDKVYVGNLDPDDFESVDFIIKSKKEGDIKLLLTYKDVFNNEYSDNKELNLKLYSKSKAIEYNLITRDGLMPKLINIIIILMIISIIFESFKNKSINKGIKAAFVNLFVNIIRFFSALNPKNIKASIKKIKQKAKDND